MNAERAPDVTVALCTWNRARLLEGALHSLAGLAVPGGVRWELLVVNNGCTDDTDAVLARHGRSLPLRRLVEPRLGVARARNVVLREARGRLVLWLDDDIRVRPDWLRAYVEAAHDWPDATFFAGAIEPIFSGAPPSWARDPAVRRGPLGLIDLGHVVRPLPDDELPFGGNMGLRPAALGGQSFDVRLGRLGAVLGSGEESELFTTLRATGQQGLWVGTARADHLVPEERLTPAYLWAYHYGRGRTLLHCEAPSGELALARIPWSWIRLWLASRLRAAWHARSRSPRWATAVERAAFTAGKATRLRRGLPVVRQGA